MAENQNDEKARSKIKVLQNEKELLTLDGSRAGVSRQLIATLSSAIKGNLSAVSMAEIQSFNIDGKSIQGTAPEILLSFVSGMKDKSNVTFQVITPDDKISQVASLKGISSLSDIMGEFQAYSTREAGGRGEKTHAGIATLLNPSAQAKQPAE